MDNVKIEKKFSVMPSGNNRVDLINSHLKIAFFQIKFLKKFFFYETRNAVSNKKGSVNTEFCGIITTDVNA